MDEEALKAYDAASFTSQRDKTGRLYAAFRNKQSSANLICNTPSCPIKSRPAFRGARQYIG